MKKYLVILLCLALFAGAIGLSWLCTHPNLLPDVETEYKTAGQAQTAQGDDALLLALLMNAGAAAPAPAEEETVSSPAFTGFGWALGCGCMLALLSVLLTARKKPSFQKALLWTAGLSLPLGLIGARLVYCLSNPSFYLSYPDAILKIWEGGLSMAGALFFVVLAGVLGARLGKARCGQVLDCLVLPMTLFICAGAFALQQLGMGFGPELDFSIPLLTRKTDGIHRLHTSFLTAVFALGMLLLFSFIFRKKRPAGHTFPLFAFLYGSGMILLESLRRDGHMLMGFVHIEMVLDIGIAFPALLYFAKKAKRIPLATAASLLLAGAVIGLEFALDRSTIGDIWLYLVYAACLAGYIWMGCSCAKQAAHV